MDKHEVARIFDEIGVLLDITGGNPFKIRAYHNAARAVENLEEDLACLVKEKRLEEIEGIGERIAQKITLLVTTGHLPYYEKLKKKVPEGLLDLLKVPGLGGKKIKTLYEKLKIKTTEDLLKACQQGKVAKLRGFGAKTQENILSGLGKIQAYSRRMLWWKAMKIGQPILEKLSELKSVKKAEIAGSVRRKLETIGDLDFLVASSKPSQVMEWFTKQPEVEKVLAKGPTKSSVLLQKGVQADIRVIPEHEFGFALLYFTGSKDHNIRIRKRALERGWSLSEYGLEPAVKKPIKLHLPQKPSEEDIYQALGLCYIPPELREDMGEFQIAEKGKLPVLIEEKDIRGVFHCHTTESDGHNTLEEMVHAAERLQWEYLGISDHSKSSFQANGMDEDRLFAQVEKIHKLNRSKKFSTHIFAGLECDILTNGKLDFPDAVLKQLDFIIVSVHRSFNLDEKTMTARLIKAIENPYTTMVGHLTGRLLLKRDGYSVNVNKVIDACIANHKIMELNAHPMRLDMDWRYWHKAKEKGLKCSINPDAHSVDNLQFFRAGVSTARKGWLEKKDVINTLPLSKIQTLLRKCLS
ncbi:MAG: DNA polymerase/3'-5' exonuclease PolX [Verrucomicrobia bacterium]|nr:DNA polymerase/3'-5' exonuclease PolX [Verrucomicrobiota bacterium]